MSINQLDEVMTLYACGHEYNYYEHSRTRFLCGSRICEDCELQLHIKTGLSIHDIYDMVEDRYGDTFKCDTIIRNWRDNKEIISTLIKCEHHDSACNILYYGLKT